MDLLGRDIAASADRCVRDVSLAMFLGVSAIISKSGPPIGVLVGVLGRHYPQVTKEDVIPLEGQTPRLPRRRILSDGQEWFDSPAAPCSLYWIGCNNKHRRARKRGDAFMHS